VKGATGTVWMADRIEVDTGTGELPCEIRMGSNPAKAEAAIDERVADLCVKQRTLTVALSGCEADTRGASWATGGRRACARLRHSSSCHRKQEKDAREGGSLALQAESSHRRPSGFDGPGSGTHGQLRARD
jgi:hypothetical protein